MKMRSKFLVYIVTLALFVPFMSSLAVAEPMSLNLDFSKPEHAAMVEQAQPNWPFSFEKDPFGNTGLFFPVGGTQMAPPPDTYPHMRYALLNVPKVDDFEFSVQTIGVGAPDKDPAKNGGNRSLSLIFGYQDYKNWWVVYYAYTNSTRVARVVDGVHEAICWPKIENVFWPNNEKYQDATIRLTTEGENKVLRTYLNGQPTPIDMCTFPADMYTPGKVGMGGHSTSTVQSWFFNQIKLNVLK